MVLSTSADIRVPLVASRNALTRTAAVSLLMALAYIVAVSTATGASLVRAALAMVIVYAFGYVTGSLLVEPRQDDRTLSLEVVRLVAGLQLTTIAFLLSLVLLLPWWSGPAGVLAFAAIVRGRAAWVPPRLDLTVTASGVAAGILAAVVLAPVFIAAVRMAPGDFPPVFFNVDTPYFLEKVHALVRTSTFPPESLGVADGRFAYHFGVHGMAAMISRGSGLAAHHTLFLLVLPVLACGVVAAAVLLARRIAPALPALVTIPILLTSIPNFWYPFWHVLGQAVSEAFSSRSLDPLVPVTANFEFWGIASNNGQNLATHFLVLASLAAVAAAPLRGWLLPVFLIGSAVLFKAPTGVALAAGFAAAQAVRAARSRSVRPLMPVLAVTGVFAAVYGAFWILPGLPVTYRTELFPLFHLTVLAQQERLPGFVADVAWLLLPALIVLPVRAGQRGWPSLPLAVLAVAPFLVVNALRAEDLRPGRSVDFDWLQVLLPVPLLVHAFVLSVANGRWTRLGAGFRAAFAIAVAVTAGPSVAMAAHYSRVLVASPENGHEFADNRALAEALRVIPVADSMIVTNDLRYPADGFARNHRQLQIPALFGHQAFAVNYAYEAYPFSRERLDLQALLTADAWSEEIEQTARTHGWTHLLVRKDYVHPGPIPLERVFENTLYAVYRFTRE